MEFKLRNLGLDQRLIVHSALCQAPCSEVKELKEAREGPKGTQQLVRAVHAIIDIAPSTRAPREETPGSPGKEAEAEGFGEISFSPKERKEKKC